MCYFLLIETKMQSNSCHTTLIKLYKEGLLLFDTRKVPSEQNQKLIQYQSYY